MDVADGDHFGPATPVVRGHHRAAFGAFDNPARGVESRELRFYLHRAIDRLDDHYRLLIALRYQNEFSYEEIASTLNLPLGTVKTGLFRAREQLRRALERYQEPSWTIS